MSSPLLPPALPGLAMTLAPYTPPSLVMAGNNSVLNVSWLHGILGL